MVRDVVGGARCVVTVAGLSGKVDHERQLGVVEERGVYQGYTLTKALRWRCRVVSVAAQFDKKKFVLLSLGGRRQRKADNQ